MALNREKIYQSAQKLAQKGQLDRAIQELGQILGEDPSDTRTLQRVAELYAKKGAYQDAVQTYVRLAEVFTKAGFYKLAVAVYHQILQLNPTLVPVLVALADTLTKLGLPQEANKIYQRAVHLLQKTDRLDDATTILRKLIAANQDDYQARLQLAETYLKIGRNDEAIRAFEEALPALRAKGRDDLFKRAAERLLYYRPDNLPLCRELAVFHLRRSNVPQAMKLLQYCHKRDPDDIETLRLLANHFMSAGTADKAIVVMNQMVQVYTKMGDAQSAQQVQARIAQYGAAAAPAAAQVQPPSSPPSPPPRSAPVRTPSSPPSPPPSPRRPAVEEPMELSADDSGIVAVEDSQRFDVPGDLEADLRPYIEEHPTGPMVGIPPSPAEAVARADPEAAGPSASGVQPLPLEPPEVEKIAAEADVFIKFGLRDRAVGHIQGGIAQFPNSVKLRDRLVAIHLGADEVQPAVRIMLDAAAILARAHPGHAVRYLREVLVLDETNEIARQRLDALLHPERVFAIPPEASAFEAGVQAPVPEPVRASAARSRPSYSLGDELDLDVEIAAESVRTVTVPALPEEADLPPLPPVLPARLETAQAPRPISAGERAEPEPALPLGLPSFDEIDQGPPAGSVFRGWGAERERAAVVDLPSFDEVEAGPVLGAAAEEGALRVATPMREAPAVIEMDDEGFDALLPAEPITSGQRTRELRGKAAASEPRPAPLTPEQDAAIAQAIEEIDFFHQQGLTDDARMLLEQLAADHGADPRVRSKCGELGVAPAAAAAAAGEQMADVLEALDAIIADKEPLDLQIEVAPAEPATEIDASDATMHYDLGVAYREMGVLDRAVEEFRIAARDPDREANCYALIGACLTALGKSKEAVEEIKHGMHAKRKTEADELDLFYEIANAYIADNDPKEALFYLQNIKKKHPDFRDVQRKIAALTSTGRPRRPPAPRPAKPERDAAVEGASIDQAFDDLFKDETN